MATSAQEGQHGAEGLTIEDMTTRLLDLKRKLDAQEAAARASRAGAKEVPTTGLNASTGTFTTASSRPVVPQIQG